MIGTLSLIACTPPSPSQTPSQLTTPTPAPLSEREKSDQAILDNLSDNLNIVELKSFQGIKQDQDEYPFTVNFKHLNFELNGKHYQEGLFYSSSYLSSDNGDAFAGIRLMDKDFQLLDKIDMSIEKDASLVTLESLKLDKTVLASVLYQVTRIENLPESTYLVEMDSGKIPLRPSFSRSHVVTLPDGRPAWVVIQEGLTPVIRYKILGDSQNEELPIIPTGLPYLTKLIFLRDNSIMGKDHDGKLWKISSVDGGIYNKVEQVFSEKPYTSVTLDESSGQGTFITPLSDDIDPYNDVTAEIVDLLSGKAIKTLKLAETSLRPNYLNYRTTALYRSREDKEFIAVENGGMMVFYKEASTQAS